MNETWHGTGGGYTYHACRCDACTRAHREHQRKWTQMRPPLAADDTRHGTSNGYCNYSCRCVPCTEAMAAYRARKARAS